MGLRAFIAIAACKLSHFCIRLLRRGGTAYPGKIALKICPDVLGILSRGVRTVVVTGTNGKTTSSRMIEQAFKELGLNYVANRSGANLLSGITTEFALHSSIFGRCRESWAVIECDEAASRRTLGLLKPKVVVVTNLFRDQLDRYGEVTHTLENIKSGLEKVPDAVLCLNADCSLTSSLASELPNRVVFFGIDASAAAGSKPSALSDATHCIRCKTEYTYDYTTYGHLGGFRCPKCGYCRRDTDFGVVRIDSMDADSSNIAVRIGEETKNVRVNLPAMYNIYNAVGSICAVTEMGQPVDAAINAVGSFRCGFGRMESFSIGKMGAKMMLVKNPAGCNQVLDFLSSLAGAFELIVCLNDNDADGTDVSWIWDVDFEKLASLGDRLSRVTVSGIRAADMWTRLKYAGVAQEKIFVQHDYAALADSLADADKPVFIIPTYTAMLDLRACLIKRCGGSDFWEG